MHQLSIATKGFQNQQKKLTFSILISNGLFLLIEFALNDESTLIRMLGTELLLTVIDLDASLIRNYAQNSQGQATFAIMQTLVDLFFRESDIGLKSQAIEAIKYMLDAVTSMHFAIDDPTASPKSSQDLDNDVFIASFYATCAGNLFASVSDLGKTGHSVPKSLTLANKAEFELLCDLLCFCVRTHGTKCRDFALENGLWKGISQLIRSSHKQLQLAALRPFRQGLLMHDDTLTCHLAEANIIESVVDVLSRMGNKNNLVNSAYLEVLSLLESGMEKSLDDIAIIVSHLANSRREELRHLSYTDIPSRIFAHYSVYIEKKTLLSDELKHESDLIHQRGVKSIILTPSIETNPSVISERPLIDLQVDVIVDPSGSVLSDISGAGSAKIKDSFVSDANEDIRRLKRQERDEDMADSLPENISPKTRRLRTESMMKKNKREDLVKEPENQSDTKTSSRTATVTHGHKSDSNETESVTDSRERKLRPERDYKRKLGMRSSLSKKGSTSPTKKSETNASSSSSSGSSSGTNSTGSGIKKTLVSAGKLVLGGLGKSKNSSTRSTTSSSATPPKTK